MWTKDKPATPGWYWVRGYAHINNIGLRIVEVLNIVPSGLFVREPKSGELGNLSWRSFYDACEWIGPLKPEE